MNAHNPHLTATPCIDSDHPVVVAFASTHAQGSNDRVGMQYGVQALSRDDASVAFSVDTAYRLQAYADDGTAGTAVATSATDGGRVEISSTYTPGVL